MAALGFEDLVEEEPVIVEEDDVPEVDEEAEPITKPGDVWQLGRHRLICGDSTDSNTFDKIMCGEKAEIAFTSPPYNADHLDVPNSKSRGGGTQKSTQKKYLADNDKRTDDEYFDFLRSNIELLIENADEVFYNIGVAAGSKRTITSILYYFVDKFKELLYWQKQNPMPVISENVISSSTELIIAFGDNNSRAFNHFNDRLFHGVISGLSASTTNEYADIHKATFPIYLPLEIITRFTSPNGIVIDCFGGTGTTLIACEQTNRTCRMIELDPRYCDVIIKRWETFTGEKAVLIND
jgi:DNA modification methylase